MKVTGTPSQEFISKLDSEDVSSDFKKWDFINMWCSRCVWNTYKFILRLSNTFSLTSIMLIKCLLAVTRSIKVKWFYNKHLQWIKNVHGDIVESTFIIISHTITTGKTAPQHDPATIVLYGWYIDFWFESFTPTPPLVVVPDLVISKQFGCVFEINVLLFCPTVFKI